MNLAKTIKYIMRPSQVKELNEYFDKGLNEGALGFHIGTLEEKQELARLLFMKEMERVFLPRRHAKGIF